VSPSLRSSASQRSQGWRSTSYLKMLRHVVSAPLIFMGVLFALYGVFALTYSGDGSGRAYSRSLEVT
jgi:hypothetical protein